MVTLCAPDGDDPKPVAVHVYEVAAGVQLAVRVEDSPGLIVEGDGVNVPVDGWLTVTVGDATAPVPAALVPVTVWFASLVGDTIPPDADVAHPTLLLHVWDDAAGVQLAVSVVDPPLLIVVGEAAIEHLGLGSPSLLPTPRSLPPPA